MYHRFHAPHDGTVEHVTYISGDTWNVNPIALKRVERAVLQERARGDPHAARPAAGHLVTLVPVAAILVASIRLHFLDVTMNMNYRGAAEIDCDAAFRKGEETRLVRAWLDDHRVCAAGLPAVRRHQPGHGHPDGPRADAAAGGWHMNKAGAAVDQTFALPDC